MSLVLKETTFNDNGNLIVKEGNFNSRKEIFDLLKKILDKPHDVVYSLTVHDECEFYYHGTKRKIEIIKDDTK